MKLRSPVTGRLLDADTPHSLAAPGPFGVERWPVVDGIPYLRTDSEGLVAVALDHLDAGCPDDALVALLTDQDAWWTGPATSLPELKRLVHERDTLNLREAMALLRMGPVADYFAYRWSDPTYLAGLALLEAHWTEPKTAFELACGIGHYLRELTRRGVACVGADVVFSKCWLAKNWVAPDAEYVVFDAGARWPVEDERFDLVMCHDAFYFMPEKENVAAQLQELVAPKGALAVSHIHSDRFWAGPKGPALSAKEIEKCFPKATLYDERELARSLAQGRVPNTTRWEWSAEDGGVEAFSLVQGGTEEPRELRAGLAMPLPGADLRPNPLLGPDGAVWPSKRYEEEYEGLSYWSFVGEDETRLPGNDPVRLRRLVDLPERW